MSGWTGDPVWLADALRAEGVKVVESQGWKQWGNGDFSWIWGVMCHHTGGANSPVSEIKYGTAALKGLLSQIHLAKDGTATLCGVGVAWHAGRGEYPGLPTNNANYHTIGIEAVNTGSEGWPDAQYDAYVRCCAAIVRRLGYGADRVIGHKEWAGRAQGKWDPGGIDMNKFRADVQARLDHKETDVSPEQYKDLNRKLDLILEQLGPWPQLGKDTLGRPLTLVDAVARHTQGGTK